MAWGKDIDHQDVGGPVSPEAARAELARVLDSATFHKATRLKRLLAYLVEQELAGQADRLKEYTVAVEAFDRPASFDPKQDAVVRVEVRRLRSKLREYFAAEGRDDPVWIDLPSGGYRPVLLRPPPRSPGRAGLAPRLAQLGWWRVAAVAALLLAAAAAVASVPRWFRPRSEPSVEAIAVLPFENLSGNTDDEYFCAGLTEELTASLATIPGLRVIARTSASRFARGYDVRTIGEKLGVDAVVEGSVRRQGSTIRVTAQLISVADQSHLWTRHYERDVEDILATQDEIAEAIAVVLRSGFVTDPRPRSSRRHVPAPDVLNLYWKGRHYRVQRTPASRQLSMACFREALDKDPAYAAAHAALAEVSATAAFHGEGTDPAGALERARESAARAIELDDTLAEPHAVIGLISFYYDWDWPAAEQAFRRAIALNPSHGQAHQMYAMGLTSRGRFDEAIAQSRMAIALDPLTFIVSPDFGVLLYLARRYDEAIERTRRTDLNQFSARGLLGMCLAGKGDYAAAIAEFEQALVLGDRFSYLLARLAHAYQSAGRNADAGRLLAELEERVEKATASHAHVAIAYAALGRKDEAIDQLGKACDRKEADANFIGVEPLFDSLHSDPRFAVLLQRLGLPASLLRQGAAR